jgi:hypothetical protein
VARGPNPGKDDVSSVPMSGQIARRSERDRGWSDFVAGVARNRGSGGGALDGFNAEEGKMKREGESARCMGMEEKMGGSGRARGSRWPALWRERRCAEAIAREGVSAEERCGGVRGPRWRTWVGCGKKETARAQRNNTISYLFKKFQKTQIDLIKRGLSLAPQIPN